MNRGRDKMRRVHGGNYYQPLPQNYDGSAVAGLEEENDAMTENLKDKIGALKSLSIDIADEVKYQDKLLRDMDEDFDRTGGFLGNTINRVLRLSKGSHNYYILYLFLFSFFVFFILYIALKFR
ncbi:BET1 homolog isoform X1 [Cimex lectularius]|uniref:BET1 homolog n=1 Tax=Cimex lectularius TaxID=79782 RepID=A0A8I6RPZ0_CIMLE|nr:BET1 homolog isoform X1 [Cimex lectularius]